MQLNDLQSGALFSVSPASLERRADSDTPLAAGIAKATDAKGEKKICGRRWGSFHSDQLLFHRGGGLKDSNLASPHNSSSCDICLYQVQTAAVAVRTASCHLFSTFSCLDAGRLLAEDWR